MMRKKWCYRILAMITVLSLCLGVVSGFGGIGNEAHAETDDTEYINLYDLIDRSEGAFSGDLNVTSKDGVNQSDYSYLFDGSRETFWRANTGLSSNATDGFEIDIQWTMKEPVEINAYQVLTGWWTANSNTTTPNRDPAAWKLYGTNDKNGTWTEIDNVTTGAEDLVRENNVATADYTVDNPGVYQYYKLTVTAIRSANKSVVIGDMNLYTKSYTNLNGKINESSIGGDANPEAIFDTTSDEDWSVDIDANDTTKSVWWSMKKAVTLDAYTLVTSKEADSTEYDPKAWTLYGRNHTQDAWTAISTVAEGELPTDRSTTSKVYYVEASDAYKYYMLTVTDNRGGNADSLKYQLSGIKLYNVGEVETQEASEYTDLSDLIIPSDDAQMAFDKDVATAWNATVDVENSDNTRTLSWDMKRAVKISAYSIVTASDDDRSDPWTWTLYGTNDKSGTWTALSSVKKSYLPEERGETSDTYDVSGDGNYQYYKLEITNNRSDLGSSVYQLAELNLYTTKVTVDNTEDYGLANAFGMIDQTSIIGDDGVKETNQYYLVLDNNYDTKWCVAIDAGNGECIRTLQWSMTEKVALEGYALATAGDVPDRDPQKWVLYATNDLGGEWTVISTVDDGNLPEERKTASDILFIEDAQEYQHYKLTILENKAGNTTSYPHYQFSELLLFTGGVSQDDVNQDDGNQDDVNQDGGNQDDGNQDDQSQVTIPATTASDITVDKAGEHGLANAFDKIKQASIKGDNGVKVTNDFYLVLDNNYDTKWCVAIETGNGECIRTLQWTMSEKVALEGYALATAGDVPNKDPQKWVLYGTNDANGEWTAISAVNEGNLPEERKTASNIFLIEEPQEYQHYKLVILESKSGNTEAHYQFSELLLFTEDEGGTEDDGNQETTTITTASDITVDKASANGLVNVFDKIKRISIKGDNGVKETNEFYLALDNNYNTKWCVPIETGNGECIRTLQWAMSEKVALEGYALVTAGDVPNKDPQKWVLYGTNDANGGWTVISTVNAGNLPEERKTASNIFLVEKPQEYQHYKLVILESKSGNTAAHYQLGELLLFGKDESTSQDSGSQGTTAGTTASSITVDNANVHGLTNLFEKINQTSIKGDDGVKETNQFHLVLDNNYSTKWCVAIDTGKGECIRTLQWSMTEKVALEGYALATAGDVPKKDPQKWVLYATNNLNGEWTVISTVNEGNLPEERKTPSNLFLIDKPTKYQHYKLVILESKSGNTEKHYQFSEFIMYGKGSATSTTNTTAASESGISMVDAVKMGLVNVFSKVDKSSVTGDEGVKASNGLSMLFDLNLSTKWCVETIIGQDGTKAVQWAMNDKITLKAYAFGTGGDVEKRDPTEWKLYGTNDVDGDWTLLDEVKNAQLPEDRKAVTDVYMIDNPGEYQHYKLVVTNNKGQRATESYRHYQLSELLLLADVDSLPEDEKQTSTDVNNVVKPSEEPVEQESSNKWWIIPIVTVIIAGVTAIVIFLLKRKKAKNEI